MVDLFELKVIEDPSYDDVYGMTQAIYAAKGVDYRTQVGAFVAGIGGSNNWKEPGGYRPHAETDALLTCAKVGISTAGETLYAPWASCVECAQDIISAGISRVVVSQGAMNSTPDDWVPKVEAGLDMLMDAGIKVEMMKPQGFTITMRDEEVEV